MTKNEPQEIKEVVVIPKKAITKKVKEKKDIDVSNPEAMIITAIKSGASIDTLERLLNLRDRVKKENAEHEFRTAMANFQSECPEIIKNVKVSGKEKEGKSTVKYNYASIDFIKKKVQPFITKYGFSYHIETVIMTEPFNGIKAIMTISHKAGHSETSSFPVPIDEKAYMSEPQKWAAARTFAVRYAFVGGFGIVTSDLDTDANPPDDEEKKKKEEAKKLEDQEILKYISALPKNIKDAFQALGYADKNDKGKAAYLFCKGHGFNNELILKHLNMLADGDKK